MRPFQNRRLLYYVFHRVKDFPASGHDDYARNKIYIYMQYTQFGTADMKPEAVGIAPLMVGCIMEKFGNHRRHGDTFLVLLLWFTID